jgi:hypothetical protein
MTHPQGFVLIPELNRLFAIGPPMSTPGSPGMIKAWPMLTAAADPFLGSRNAEALRRAPPLNGKPTGQAPGTTRQRITCHCWYHIGETQAMRRLLGHRRLPTYVGTIEKSAPYRRG